jgi:hypothetical protein
MGNDGGRPKDPRRPMAWFDYTDRIAVILCVVAGIIGIGFFSLKVEWLS